MRLPLSPARRSGKKADKGQYAPFVQIGGHPSGGFRARDLMSRHRSLRVLQLHYVVFCSTQDHLPEENARLTCRTVGPAAWVYLRR